MNKKFLAGILLLLVIIVCSKTFATAEIGHIDLVLTKTEEVTPDIVEIVIGVETSDKSAKIATDENKRISNEVQAKIKTLIDESKGDYIKTSNYRLSPQSVYKDGKSVFEKYVAINNVTIYTKNLDDVSKIIDTAINLGATNVNDLNFSVKSYDDACTKLQTDLISQAKKQAAKMVSPTGARIKGIRSIESRCSIEGNYPRAMYSVKMAQDVESAQGTPIQKGKVKINATVNASFFVK